MSKYTDDERNLEFPSVMKLTGTEGNQQWFSKQWIPFI